MPYSKTTLTQTGLALNVEMRGVLDAALTASGKYTKVTSGFISSTRTYDVWLNDGTTDGYQWYLIVMTDSASSGRLMLGGALEYDPGTRIAKKALRGNQTAGFVDAAGYPLVSAGGAEMTFPLGSFLATNVANTAGSVGGHGNSAPAVAASGNTMRILVTGQFVWVWWGTVFVSTSCHGVGTYRNIHSTIEDLTPLAFIAHSGNFYGGSVWQNPLAIDSAPRSTGGSVLSTTAAINETWTRVIGQVGVNGPDKNYGYYVASSLHVCRRSESTVDNGGHTTIAVTSGWSLGLAPADFLLFGRVAEVAIGDTVNVDGKVYESVTNPAASVGLFINTQPAI